MIKLTFNIIRLVRVRQWIKNFAIFASAIFAGTLFDTDILNKIIPGFFAYCALSSSIYIINDIFDKEKDRLHPVKKYRPIARGDISVPLAFLIAGVLAILGMTIGFSITTAFSVSVIFFLILQISYSAFLKNIAIIDILALAAGYILRVYAGEFASGMHISVWLLLTTISLSLFLAIGKRRSELTLISKYAKNEIEATRKSLSHYSERLLDTYASIFATSTFISYSLFTFLESSSGFKPSIGIFIPEFLPTFFQRKWLMITIIPVVYGIMRYMQDIYEKQEGESPEKVLLSDTSLLVTVFIWLALVIGIIYFIGE